MITCLSGGSQSHVNSHMHSNNRIDLDVLMTGSAGQYGPSAVQGSNCPVEGALAPMQSGLFASPVLCLID